MDKSAIVILLLNKSLPIEREINKLIKYLKQHHLNYSVHLIVSDKKIHKRFKKKIDKDFYVKYSEERFFVSYLTTYITKSNFTNYTILSATTTYDFYLTKKIITQVNGQEVITFPNFTNYNYHVAVWKKQSIERMLHTYSFRTKDLVWRLLQYTLHSGYQIVPVKLQSVRAQKISALQKKLIKFEIRFAKEASYAQKPQEEFSMKGAKVFHKGTEFITHTTLDIHETALAVFHKRHLQYLIAILFIVYLLIRFVGFKTTIISFVSFLTVFYFIDLIFNGVLILSSFFRSSEINVLEEDITERTDWPTYTIFCPLYKELNIIPQFISAIKEIDYPKDRLEVFLLLEEDDVETIKGAEEMNLPAYFKIVVVPHSLPKTKPKAVNWGLTQAQGEYAVIYDAEDMPEKDQLKKAILAFEKMKNEKVICLQAKLNFYNPRQNILTRLFVAEYSLWFDFILTGLQTLHAPIPLGGTSNHFRTADLSILQGWDPFNVTEDCDLGIRIFKKGYKTAIFNSTTWEEANSNYKNWLRQRSRWIKGYMQTYLVHMKYPLHFLKGKDTIHFFSFQLIVGGKAATLFINPLLWAITINYFIFRPYIGKFIESFFPGPIFYMGVLCLVFGNFLYLYYHVVGLAKRGYWDLIKYFFLIPFYWIMMSVSAIIAVEQLFLKPHFWEKTNHGLHLKNNGTEEVPDISILLKS